MSGFVDIAVAIILVMNGYAGFRSGFVRQIVQVTALGIGLWLAMRHYVEMGLWIGQRTELPPWGANGVAWMAIWLAVVLVGVLLSNLLDHILSAVFLGPLNAMAGFFVGVLRGILVLLPVLFLLGYFNIGPYLNSRTGQFVQPLIQAYIQPFYKGPLTK
ncbi:MAG: CvpA family protein [Candidatus Margulisiibacteriota bacterium]